MTILIRVGSAADVDRAFADAVAAGATSLCPPRETFWGGYDAYFADPDGHIWEIAHNPAWPIGADGRPVLGDAGQGTGTGTASGMSA